jgi:hypothetical protein
MDIQEIFSLQLYKLPYETKFKLISNAQVFLYVAASITARNAAGLIGVNVKIDGTVVAASAVYANEPASSRPTVAMLVKIPNPTVGEHTLMLEATTQITMVGPLDYACGTIFYQGSSVDPFIWRVSGPVPKQTKFKSPMSGKAVLYLAGSGYMKTPQVCGLSVTLDGNVVAKSQMLPGIGNSHFAFPPVFVPVQLKPKEYEVGLIANPDVLSDGNDNFEVGILY